LSPVELSFEPTPAFGKYRPFLEHGISHPTKTNTNLLEFLIEKWTNPDDVILDCMAGAGTTGVVAALHGRNAIQVEIEPLYYTWMEEARRKVESATTFVKKGWIRNFQGDARNLSKMLSHVDVIITSPPYTNQAVENPNVYRYRKGGMFAEERLVDAVITSPPYLTDHVKYSSEKFWRKAKERGKRWGSKPPAGTERRPTGRENIGNLPFGDINRIKILEKNKDLDVLHAQLMVNGRRTYLSEMLTVYKEMFNILKPKGRAIVIVRPFYRGHKPIDLPYYTYLLMSAVGFKLEMLYKIRLEAQSFWRRLYHEKNPDIPAVRHEYALVMLKPDDSGKDSKGGVR